ncbi:MAG TPA: NADH-quinone oxidoreductase subunit H, partial [Chloroflexota bacterium]|nr:NADH-quinone oxidoreductase subunit H [Chloroflexota bacterium]
MDGSLTLDLVRSLLVIFGLLTGMAYMTWFERRAISRIQVRIGPNRTGPGGLLQPLADALKLFFKEDIAPASADRLLYPIAPALALFAALAAFAVVPLGPTVSVAGVDVPLQVADLPVGVLYL